MCIEHKVFSANKSSFQFSTHFTSRIKEISKPLERYLGITYFAYVAIYNDCRFLVLSNACDSFLEKGIFHIKKQDPDLIKFLQSVAPGMPNYYIWPTHFDTLPPTMALHDEYNIWHGFNIMYRHEDYCESFNFAFNKQTGDMNDFYCKNSILLTKFANYFKMQVADLIDDKDQSKFAYYPEKFNFSYIEDKNLKDFISEIEHNCSLKNINGNLVNITKRESECLKLLASGKSLKATANLLGISQRTSEWHINNIKQKLGINYKSQLIDIVNSVNYFNSF